MAILTTGDKKRIVDFVNLHSFRADRAFRISERDELVFLKWESLNVRIRSLQKNC